MAPLSLLPSSLQSLATWMPWRYTLSFPIELAMGRVNGAGALLGLGVALVWSVALYALARLLWRLGLRHYTGWGM